MTEQQAKDVLQRGASSQVRPGTRPLATGVQAHLGRQLKAVYASLDEQPVPERFKQLLDELERAQAGPPAEGEEAARPAQKA